MSRRVNAHDDEVETSFVEILRERAIRHSGKTVFGSFEGVSEAANELTFAELDRQARSIASLLQRLDLVGERAILLYPPGLEFIAAFFGCLYAGVVAVPANLPRLNRPMPRLRAIVADARPRAVLSTRGLAADADRWVQGVPELAGLHVVATDGIGASIADRWESLAYLRDSIAFLQYTSGSTATPKGVMITHGNLVANSEAIRACFGSTERSRGVFWLPLFHDMGLIGGVLQTIHCGGSSLLMSPASFLQQPRRWLEAISRSGATISGGPDFAFDLCVRKIGPEQRQGLDLSTWEVAFNGAEPIRPETLDRFAAVFAPCGFRREAFLPCYGLAESTLLVSGLRPSTGPMVFQADATALGQDRVESAGAEGTHDLVSSGGVPTAQDVAIVDPVTGRRSPPDRVGEIWVRGPSVARGYWRNEEATAAIFRARLADSDGGAYLRTGDLGFLRDGNLFVTGRLKDLMIIRGRNIYPQDVEWIVSSSHDALRPGGAAAFSVEINGQERAVVVCEVERSAKSLPLDEIIDAIRRTVSEAHEIDLHAIRLIRPLSLPRTSSGKVQRHACRDAFNDGSLDVVGGWTKAEPPVSSEVAAVGAPQGRDASELRSWLTARLAAVMGIAPSEIDPTRPISGYGLDSLTAMELKASIDAELGIDLPLSSLLDGPTLAQLAEDAAARVANGGGEPQESPSEPIATTAVDALSVGQQSLWYAHQLSPRPGTYNIAGAARIRSEIDPGAFRRAVQRLVDRHDALRTSFPFSDGRPSIKIHGHMDAQIQFVDASDWDEDRLQAARNAEAARPFDIERDPLHRVLLWRRAPRVHDVLLVVHHIIGDFWTTAVFLDEFSTLYRAETTGGQDGPESALRPLPLQYSDFVRWQAEKLASPAGERLASYWRRRLAGSLPHLDLPTDRPRTPVRNQSGAVRTLDLSEALTRSITAFAESRGVSIYVTLLATLQVLLSRYSGQDDVIVGSPVSGRTREGLEGIVGYFVNLVPMRTDLTGNPTFEELLGRVRSVVHGGLEHQDYPFGRMVEDLSLAGDTSRTPVFSVMFIYQKAQRLRDAGLTPFALSAPGHTMTLGGLTLESLGIDKGTALFDLTLMVAIGSGRLGLSMEYSTDLFDAETIDRLLGHYRTLLEGIVAEPLGRIRELPILTSRERDQVLGDWAIAPAPACRKESVLHLFEEHATSSPHVTAVVADEDRISYRDLNEKAAVLATRLRGLGVGRGDVVGLCCARSVELIAGLLGILKAGAAYLPLDPSHPEGRLRSVIRDALASAVVVDRRSRSMLENVAVKLIELGADADASPPGLAKPLVEASDPAYVVYTSGSTGVPKGVMISHGSLMAAFMAWEEAYELRPSPHLQMASVAFDVFTGDWARALGSGGTLVLCPRDVLLDPETLLDLMCRERIAFAEFVPAVVEGLVSQLEIAARSLPDLRLIAVGSDQWHAGLHERLRRVLRPSTRIVNSYGLTEATIDSTFFEGSLAEMPADRTVPIGRPFAGTKAYLLDRDFRPVPVGVAGELFLGGPGLAIGYWRRPGLTAERFVPDPSGSTPGSRLYRTGDLARWRSDGSLELLGRADGQVKIRGYRIELGEIESAILRHPGVRDAAVVVREDGERRLSGFVVGGDELPLDITDLRRWLQIQLPEYMVPATLVPLDRLPLSPNGKVDRRSLAAIEPPKLEGAHVRVAPRNAVEATLATIVAEVLGVGIVGVEDDLFALGSDSISIIQMVSRARRAGLRLDPARIFRDPTIARLAQGLEVSKPEDEQPAARSIDLFEGWNARALSDAIGSGGDVEDAYPLSPVQEGMLFHSLLDPEAGAYVEQFACCIRGDLDPDRFDEAWRTLVRRHTALRTAIRWVESDRPIQLVLKDAEPTIDHLDWRHLSPGSQHEGLDILMRDDRRRGYVLSFAPLMRLAVIRLNEDTYQMIWSSHHLIVDGWCVPLLLGEVMELYDAASSGREPALSHPRPFRDYLTWLHDRDTAGAENYWRRALASFTDPTPIGIEPAGAGDLVGSHYGEKEFRLDTDATAHLIAWARSRRMTISTLVYGAWAILLSRYAGRSDVVFGVTVSGRPPELEGVENIVGVLINTLPLRVAVDEGSSIDPWLAAIQARLVEMREFESCPLVTIQGWSGVARGRPLFESIVIVQNTPGQSELAGTGRRIGVDNVRMHEQTSYPITVTIAPGDRLQIRLGYDSRRFDQAAVERMLGQFRTLLEGLADGGNSTLGDLMLSGPDELQHANGHADAYAGLETDVELLMSQVESLSADEVDAYLTELRGSKEGGTG